MAGDLTLTKLRAAMRTVEIHSAAPLVLDGWCWADTYWQSVADDAVRRWWLAYRSAR